MTTLFDKIWAAHAVARNEAGEDLVYIDRHLVQEVSSPQAFASMAESGHTLTVVLDFANHRATGFASNDETWHQLSGTFEVVN